MHELATAAHQGEPRFRFDNTDDIEPRVRELLDARLERRKLGAYWPLKQEDVRERLNRLLEAKGLHGFAIERLKRMAGGASKEQFSFDLVRSDGTRKTLVLRIDPRESIVETCRYREAEAAAAFEGLVPVAPVWMVDGDGEHMGQPAAILEFVEGTTKPPIKQNRAVTGMGITLDDEWRARLAPEFVDTLVRIHDLDVYKADLPHFSIPDAYPEQAAVWNLNWWAKVWREDETDPYPFLTYTERWLRERLPRCDEPVFLHGDYRFGNYLFDPETGKMTAMLDWELSHIGDFHEDLAWSALELFGGPPVDGEVRISGLMRREDFFAEYEKASGRTINPRRLAFYEVLSALKGAGQNIGTSNSLAMRQTNHQDVLQCWITPVGHSLLDQAARVMREEEKMR